MTGFWRSVYALTHDVLDVLIGGDPEPQCTQSAP